MWEGPPSLSAEYAGYDGLLSEMDSPRTTRMRAGGQDGDSSDGKVTRNSGGSVGIHSLSDGGGRSLSRRGESVHLLDVLACIARAWKVFTIFIFSLGTK